MVEIPLHMALVAFQMRLLVGRVAGQRLRPVAHAVRFHIGFGHHVEAILVAEVIPVRVVGIVAGAHRIDVELLHELDILLHALARNHIAAVRVEFVAVHALDQDAFAVDQQVGALDFHFAETGVEMQGLQQLAPVVQFDVQPVQIGIFGAPFVGIFHEEAADKERACGLDRVGRLFPFGVVEMHFHVRFLEIGYRYVDGQRAVAVVFIQVRRDGDVFDVLHGPGI